MFAFAGEIDQVGVAAQPGVQILRPLEIEQNVVQGFQSRVREGFDACFLAGSDGSAAALEPDLGDDGGFDSASFLPFLLVGEPPTLLPAQLKDLAIRHAACEVVDGDSTHGADLGYEAAAEAR